MPRRIWTNRRKWLGNLIPFFLGVCVGLLLLPVHWILACVSGIVTTWWGVNVWGFFENRKIEQELRTLTLSDGELIGFVYLEPASFLDAHAEIGLLKLSIQSLEIFTEDNKVVLARSEILGVSRRANIHSILMLGGWIVISLADSRELTLESRKHHTMLGSRRRTKLLFQELMAWQNEKGPA